MVVYQRHSQDTPSNGQLQALVVGPLAHGPPPSRTQWYAKRFLHPDIVSAYEYIFIWDEDLGIEHFNGDKYINLVKKHGLEISQPGLEPNNGLTWEMTKRRGDKEVHMISEEKLDWCSDPHLPPCDIFNLNPIFMFYQPAHEKIGVIDSQWIVHQVIPSLGCQVSPH
uniref:Uncharacterized protein n=1 Tax=Cajanus cajan TaxID=3821 RepID=A0A151QL76_CAJCA|nr:hypothetical protein KK1_049152 [Cajanus cajan]